MTRREKNAKRLTIPARWGQVLTTRWSTDLKGGPEPKVWRLRRATKHRVRVLACGCRHERHGPTETRTHCGHTGKRAV